MFIVGIAVGGLLIVKLVYLPRGAWIYLFRIHVVCKNINVWRMPLALARQSTLLFPIRDVRRARWRLNNDEDDMLDWELNLDLYFQSETVLLVSICCIFDSYNSLLISHCIGWMLFVIYSSN